MIKIVKMIQLSLLYYNTIVTFFFIKIPLQKKKKIKKKINNFN